ncbi:histidine phosphatase family protein [Roseibacterium sp. SDUM158017]|uniref:histidine phosphatase family protein n=1 Tax=Roseicyclus salinarum TaxID=3036773 RepID=UPI002414D2BE|nr:histidine phosphatase family protein [Roseibacterium sp. SDUM158017]MDG4650395.1 histidine phosphatase family protein [Roseibacterium sp. SDUM158017]
MPPNLPALFVLRHGETEWNVAGRLQGHLDSPLTALGRVQAARQNAILREVLPEGAEALVSDSGRSVETARIALAGLDLPVRSDPRLREVALGRWQGLTLAEIEAGWGGLIAERDPFEWKFDAPGGETLRALADRAASVLAEIARPTVVVTHGLTSRVLRCLALGHPPEALASLPGGQGVVHVIEGRVARTLGT